MRIGEALQRRLRPGLVVGRERHLGLGERGADRAKKRPFALAQLLHGIGSEAA